MSYMDDTRAGEPLRRLTRLETFRLDSALGEQLLRKFYPRKYSCPGGYTSPKVAARVFACHCKPEFVIAANGGRPIPGRSDAHVFVVGACLARLGMPTYWVDRELAAAAAQTAPPETLKLEDLKFPMDGMLFMLPEGTLDPPGQPSSWLGVSKILAKNGGWSVGFVSGGSGPTYSVTLRASEPLSSFDSLDFETISPVTGEVDPSLTSPEDTKFTKKMCHLGTTIIMLMAARPELVAVETARDATPTADGRTSRNKLFRPNWIGRGYRAARKEGLPEGTHASPHMHWRRGHWRHQPFGPQRRERKDIWLEPCIVGHEPCTPEEASCCVK